MALCSRIAIAGTPPRVRRARKLRSDQSRPSHRDARADPRLSADRRNEPDGDEGSHDLAAIVAENVRGGHVGDLRAGFAELIQRRRVHEDGIHQDRNRPVTMRVPMMTESGTLRPGSRTSPTMYAVAFHPE